MMKRKWNLHQHQHLLPLGREEFLPEYYRQIQHVTINSPTEDTLEEDIGEVEESKDGMEEGWSREPVMEDTEKSIATYVAGGDNLVSTPDREGSLGL